MMNIARSEKAPADEHEPSSTHEPQNEVRGAVRADAAPYRPQPARAGDIVTSEAYALVERVSASSTNEIDKLINQLQSLREFFKQEGQRIQREIADYAHLGDAMMRSTKTMVESMAQLKHTGDITQDEAV